MKKSLFLLITTFLLCSSVQASSVFYHTQGGANDGVYKVDMTTGSCEQIFSGSQTASIDQFDSNKLIVSDNATSRILILDTEGTIYNSFPSVGPVRSAIRNPDNPNELLYTVYTTGQLRKINLNTGADSLVVSITNALKVTSRCDGTVFVASWWASGYRGSMLHDLSLPDTSNTVLASTWMSALVGDNYGNLFYSMHPQFNPNSIAKIELAILLLILWYGTMPILLSSGLHMIAQMIGFLLSDRRLGITICILLIPTLELWKLS